MKNFNRTRAESIGVGANENMFPDMLAEAVTYITEQKKFPLPDDLPEGVEKASHVGELSALASLKKLLLCRGLLAAPLTLVFGVCAGIIGPVSNELIKTRVCETVYQFSANFCAHIGQDQGNTAAANQVRERTTNYVMYNTLVAAIPSVVFTLFLGSWSDRHGRKFPMAFSLVGFILSCAMSIPVAFLQINPLFLLISAGLSSIFGGWPIFIASIHSYIGDYTTEKNRAAIFAINMGFLGIGVSIGLKVGTVLLQHYGFHVPYFLYLGLHCFSVLYVILLIKDHEDFDQFPEISHTASIGSIFQLQSIKDNWQVLKRKRIGNTRFHILILLASYTAMVMCIENEGTILQLLVEFQPLGWTVGQYGTFTSTGGILGCIALIITIPIFKRMLKMSDTTMGVVSSLSGIFCTYGYAISVHTWMVYTAMSVGLIRQLSFVCMQSILIALVDRTEVGKTMSIVGSIQSVSQIISVLLFVKIFGATAAWWPGFVFAVQAFMLVSPLIAFCTVDATLSVG